MEKEDESMALSDLETDLEQQVDSDGDSGIGDVGSVKYVTVFSWEKMETKGIQVFDNFAEIEYV